MAEHNKTGKAGEELAVKYLRENGYEIVDCNWRFKHYEIDIIAKKGNILSIVEVKSLSSNYFGEPEEGVSKKKERFLSDAAHEYVCLKDLDVEVRYDIISIIFSNGKYELKMIEDAFYPFS